MFGSEFGVKIGGDGRGKKKRISPCRYFYSFNSDGWFCFIFLFVSDARARDPLLARIPFYPSRPEIISSLRLHLPSKFPVALPSPSAAAALLSRRGRLQYEFFFFLVDSLSFPSRLGDGGSLDGFIDD